ncbi:MAG TPA: DUF5011 domain-containing protein [Chitinophagaceae bacterium]
MKYFKILMLSLLLLPFAGCEKTETFNNTADRVGHSRVIFFPIVTLKGDRYMVVPVGGTFTDPGVTAKVGDADVPSTTSGTVNTSAPGVYTLVYTALNSDGFAATAIRTVAVYSTDASAAANDLSGNYLRAATGITSTWIKMAPGVYQVINPGGAAAGASLVAIVFNATGFTVDMPTQVTSDGLTSSTTSEVYTNGSPSSYSWIFLNPGYGTGVRTFVKQ